MNDQQLKPCPFCGSTKVVFRPGDAPRTHIILCLDCDISAGEYYSRSELIEAWNNRPDPWTTITADPATLPEESEYVLVSVRHENLDHDLVMNLVTVARLWFGEWRDTKHVKLADKNESPYAWQPWPTPPPYPSADEEQAR